MRTFPLFSMLSLGLVFLCTLGCQNAVPPKPVIPPPDVIAFLNVQRGMESELMKKMKEQPNYNGIMESFAQNFSDNLSSAGGTQFPRELIALLNDGMDQPLTGQEAVDKFFDNILAFQMNVWLIPIEKKPEETPKIEGTITVVTKQTAEDVEKALTKMDSSKYKLLEKEGDRALYEFTIRQNPFFIGYSKLSSGNALVIVASDKRDRMERQLEEATEGQFEETYLSSVGPFGQFVILPSFFAKTKSNVIDKVLKDTEKVKIVDNLAGTLGVMDQCVITLEDVENVTVGKINMSIPDEEERKKRGNAWKGIFSLMKMLKPGSGDGMGIPEPVVKFAPLLNKIVVTQEDTNVVLTYKWDDPKFFTVVDELLGQTQK
ncbi:MAG: hypothetical protein ACRC10_07685 [Thermoguttaceae bacterium]